MARLARKKRAKRSPKQREATAGAQKERRKPLGDISHTTNSDPCRIPEEEVQELKTKVQVGNTRFYNARRRNSRLQKVLEARKEELKKVKAGASLLRGAVSTLEKEAKEIKNDAREAIVRLKDKIERMKAAQKDLNQHRVVLWKRCKRLTAAKAALKRHIKEMSKSRPFTLMRRGRYTSQTRSLARLLVSSGTAERKVGNTLKDIGGILGIDITESISARSVQRFVLEEGVAADIQLIYEIIKSANITYSCDSTSHKHIEYECRTIALQVVDYTNPEAKPQWKLRTLGVDTSVNHASQTQVDGLRRRLEELGVVFNNSPLAKREDLRFVPGDFAYRLLGTSGDHAADQKKSHNILQVWRLEVILQRLGEDALFKMDAGRVLAVLLTLKLKQINEIGGQEIWEALSYDEKAAIDIAIICEVGKQVFDTLPDAEQVKLTRFIRTGCCMHKDLNCVKGGVKELEAMWIQLKKTPPILLANKENAATLANQADASAPTPNEKHAEEVSKRGATKLTTLGGLMFRNKDKKKGQQDTYDWYMEHKVGHRVPYPDVSNTRYGSHGEAAATIIVYRCHFTEFIKHIRDAKDRPGMTNIEKNFSMGINDIPTLTELCVLALYNIAVSRPFMAHVRTHDNILKLEAFFEKKASFLECIVQNPKIWTGGDITHENGSLDGREWDEWSLKVIAGVKVLVPDLPDINHAVAAFATGARTTFVERFSEEFKKGGGIDTLTENERDELYFSSTNDANEGGLGSWRRGQARRPAETLHKFNAHFTSARNHTAAFMFHKLTQEEDELYLIRTARERDSSGKQKQIKAAQMQADAEKVTANRETIASRAETMRVKAAIIRATAKELELTDAGIENLKVMVKYNAQLDCFRALELLLPIPPDVIDPAATGSTPLKSHMKNNVQRVEELKKSRTRFLARRGTIALAQDLLSERDERPVCGNDAQYLSDDED